MPRPVKEGLDYFSLDTDLLTRDKRIKKLLRQYGADGITFLIALWCDIYGGTGYYVVADDEYLEEMAHDTGINFNTIRQIVGYLLSRSLFDNTLFQSVKVLTAPGIQRRYQLAVKERVRKRRTPVIVETDYWLLPEEEDETVTIREDGQARCIKVIQRSIVPRNNAVVPRNNEVIPRNKCTKESKGKESKGKDSKEGEGEAPPACSTYGRYGNVVLSEAEYTALAADFGESIVRDYIERLGLHMKSTGKAYGSHEATIRRWIREDAGKKREQKKAAARPNRFHNADPSGTDYDEVVRGLSSENGIDGT